MQYTKTVTDTADDTARVQVNRTVDVYLSSDIMCFTPKQARSLARALKRAANVAEGKPAKAKKKPRTEFRDGDGDYWYLSPNGFYGIDAPSDTAHRTLDSVIASYGTWGTR